MARYPYHGQDICRAAMKFSNCIPSAILCRKNAIGVSYVFLYKTPRSPVRFALTQIYGLDGIPGTLPTDRPELEGRVAVEPFLVHRARCHWGGEEKGDTQHQGLIPFHTGSFRWIGLVLFDLPPVPVC